MNLNVYEDAISQLIFFCNDGTVYFHSILKTAASSKDLVIWFLFSWISLVFIIYINLELNSSVD